MFIEEVLRNETILALQGRRLDPISTLREAEDIFDYSGAILPPDNAAFRLVWFLGRELQYHNRVYIRYEYPAPDPLHAHVAWDRSRVMGDLELSEGRFIETEPTIVKLWDHWLVGVILSHLNKELFLLHTKENSYYDRKHIAKVDRINKLER